MPPFHSSSIGDISPISSTFICNDTWVLIVDASSIYIKSLGSLGLFASLGFFQSLAILLVFLTKSYNELYISMPPSLKNFSQSQQLEAFLHSSMLL